MNYGRISQFMINWLDDYCNRSGAEGFVVGVSGGVDSALCSTLAAATGRPTLCVELSIHQPEAHVARADRHIEWLRSEFDNVESECIDLTAPFDSLMATLPSGEGERYDLASANTRSRLRMTTLYFLACRRNALVVGTGNKIEDYGIGFFTKYGDGGVDLSPIGDLTKTQVFAVASFLGVGHDILSAAPTDGLFGDDRTDENQIGASYPELEWAMEQFDRGAKPDDFEGRNREVFEIYARRNRANRHKVDPVPVCIIPEEYK